MSSVLAACGGGGSGVDGGLGGGSATGGGSTATGGGMAATGGGSTATGGGTSATGGGTAATGGGSTSTGGGTAATGGGSASTGGGTAATGGGTAATGGGTAATGGGTASVDAGVRRPVTICLTGACTDLSANCGSNEYFTAICDELSKVDAGLVLSSSGFTFATTPNLDAKSVVAPLFTALDLNKDNKVNALDGPIEMNILGFSWGGQNAGDLSRRIAADSRIDQSVLYHRVVVLDGFQPFQPAIAMPATANEAWSFRHSKASSGDCSNTAPLGPYLGHRIACAAGQNCHDYDFSLAPTDLFHGIFGASVGHCDVPYAAHDYVIDLVTKGKVTTALPPSVPVTP